MIVRLKTWRQLMPLLQRDLSLNREYRVLAIEAGAFRLLNGSGERDGPFLYDAFFFKILDPTEDDDWISELKKNGERSTRPASFGPSTWKDYFEGKPDAAELVRDYVARCSPCSWEVSPHRYLPHGPDKRIGMLERLRFLARPAEQARLKQLFRFDDLTERVLRTLVDIMPHDLHSEAERRAVEHVAEVAAQISTEFVIDGAIPPIGEFIKTKQSAKLAAAAAEALRIFMPDGYRRYLGEPSGRTPLPPTAEDLQRARNLAKTDCPRRYCSSWHSTTFDWGMPVAEGCTWLDDELAIEAGDFTPCSRCDPTAPRDHYEPEHPYLLDDGFAGDHFDNQ